MLAAWGGSLARKGVASWATGSLLICVLLLCVKHVASGRELPVEAGGGPVRRHVQEMSNRDKLAVVYLVTNTHFKCKWVCISHIRAFWLARQPPLSPSQHPTTQHDPNPLMVACPACLFAPQPPTALQCSLPRYGWRRRTCCPPPPPCFTSSPPPGLWWSCGGRFDPCCG